MGPLMVGGGVSPARIVGFQRFFRNTAAPATAIIAMIAPTMAITGIPPPDEGVGPGVGPGEGDVVQWA